MPSVPRTVKKNTRKTSMGLPARQAVFPQVPQFYPFRAEFRLFFRGIPMRGQALRAHLLMLLTALTWGTAFVAQRLRMDAIGPFLYSGLRFALGALVLLPPLLYRPSGNPSPPPVSRSLLLGGLLL